MQVAPMIVERQRWILERLTDRGSVRVVDLARDLQVTTETIRRDLRQLDDAGRLQRTHGGAVPAEGAPEREPPLRLRQSIALPEKIAVASAAADMVRPGEVIALDASSTAIELAKRLPDDDLTVVSPSPVVCLLLAERKHTRVVCTGGTLDDDAVCFTGPIAEAVLAKLHIDRCFLSCRGVDPDRGLSEATDRHGALKSRMLAVADQAVLMIDRGKLDVSGAFFFADLSDVDVVMVDRAADSIPMQRLRERLRLRELELELVTVTPPAAQP
ncbi:MAG: DeoR/GlpR family DNA-binding transcription regulator [Planctomycetota bacterium]